jgi:putative chitinase
VSPEVIAACTGARIDRAERFAPYLSAGMAFYGIDTPQRQAPFLANIGHESGGLKWLSEIWGPTAAQKRYERNFDAPWPADDKEARKDHFAFNRLAYRLGNTQRGDGSKFRGHGLLHTTGRGNHVLVRNRLRERFDNVPDFEVEPEALMDLQWAALSACDYADMRRLNDIADGGDFDAYVIAINGGLNGYEDRCERFAFAKKALGLA